MAHSLSAKKRIRQSEKARIRNKSYKSRMKTYIKKFISSLSSGDNEASEKAYKEAAIIIDRTASKGIIHKNAAARRKSRLFKKLKNLTQKEQSNKE
jgi:small subunit ribosomal protein S20